MLTKNIYLLYPAGYSGNFIKWAISASDIDLQKITVNDPINKTFSHKYGGPGTTHLEDRVPTHQDIYRHLIWMAYNRPVANQIYILFTTSQSMSQTLDGILSTDPDPLIIIIHDNRDRDTRTYGNLNAITKWPTYMHTRQTLWNFEKQSRLEYSLMTNHDFFNCENDMNLRNMIALKSFAWLVELDPFDDQSKNQYLEDLLKNKLWFDTRQQYQPHELLPHMYAVHEALPNNAVHQLSCKDVVSENFPNILYDILKTSGCCSEFDISPVKQIHEKYISAQKNLDWFSSIAHWRKTGYLDQYLVSHAVIQGFVIQEILEKLKFIDYIKFDPHYKWYDFYQAVRDQGWPDCDQEKDFLTLPLHIREELITKFNYKFEPIQVQNNQILKALENWESMSIQEINDLYLQSDVWSIY